MNIFKRTLCASLFFTVILCAKCDKIGNFESERVNILDFKLRGVADPIKIIKSFGYPAETHRVITEDGYILTLHRIPRGIKGTSKRRPPVLIMHGLSSSSADFININPERSLGYLLADQGYDVWMGNARGNSYSNKHIYIDRYTDPQTFYDFSWHEIGVIDIPTKMDYILDLTNHASLYYIGHSQGCTSFYVMASTRPEYNSKIRIASLMGPAGFVSNTPEALIRFLSQHVYHFQALLEYFHVYHLPFLELTRGFMQNLCRDGNYYAICKEVYYLFGAGYDDDFQLNQEILPLIFQTTPSDASVKQFIHYFQEVKSGKFQQFDYGLENNIRIYGTANPKEYNLSAITAPIGLYYGKNDRLIAVKDVEQIVGRLKNVANNYLIPYEKFNHGDFLFANDAKPLVYNELLRIMEFY